MGNHQQMRFGSKKLHWLVPDAFGFIREMKLKPPRNFDTFIDLSIGAPNRATPKNILDQFVQDVYVEKYHTYPPQFGAMELCEAVAEWYEKRFAVRIDPRTEVLITVGIKEAIFNAFHALLNPGEVLVIPDPGYPTYFEAGDFCGAKLITYNSNADEAAVLQEIEAIAELHHPSYVVVNYPSNPTGRLVGISFYEQLSRLASRYDFAVMSDLAYSEIAFDDRRATSYLTGNNGTSMALEFFAFSKTYNMAGWRVGAIVAQKEILDAVKLYKSKIDSNVFYPIQLAAATALKSMDDTFYQELSSMYQKRRDILCAGLSACGLRFTKPEGAMYVWVEVPAGMNAWDFIQVLYDDYGFVGVPGTAYGKNGGGYIRLGLVQEEAVLEEVAKRLGSGNFA
jgi:LL-diaminopimelate aminotransferase